MQGFVLRFNKKIGSSIRSLLQFLTRGGISKKEGNGITKMFLFFFSYEIIYSHKVPMIWWYGLDS